MVGTEALASGQAKTGGADSVTYMSRACGEHGGFGIRAGEARRRQKATYMLGVGANFVRPRPIAGFGNAKADFVVRFVMPGQPDDCATTCSARRCECHEV